MQIERQQQFTNGFSANAGGETIGSELVKRLVIFFFGEELLFLERRDAGLDDDSLSDEEIIETICEYPALMQRPIVVRGNQAIIGRPPVKVLDLIA